MNVFDIFFGGSKEVANARMDICRSCEHFKPAWEQCAICGCYMKWKTLLTESQCPLDKWKSINIKETGDTDG